MNCDRCIKCGEREAQKGRRVCRKCRHASYVEKDPVKASYLNLKRHAKSRGIFFSLTLEHFRRFCIKTEYVNKKGVRSESYHVDRVVESVGYIDGNIQALTNSENVKKYVKWSNGDFITETIREPDHSDVPF